MEELAARFVRALVRVGAEKVALSLEKIRRQLRASVPIEERERGAKARQRNAEKSPFGNDFAPSRNAARDFADEKRIYEKAREIRMFVIRLFDLAEELTADNAAAAPQEGDRAKIEFPLVFFRGFAHEHEALRIADDLRRIERVCNLADELLFIAGEGGARRLVVAACFHALFF